MANESLITLEEFAEIIGVNKDCLRNLRVKMGIPNPIIDRRTGQPVVNKSLYDRKQLMFWAEINDVKKALYEARTGKPYGDRHKRYIRKEKKIPRKAAQQPSSIIMAFLMGKYDHPEKRHSDERRLDKARERMPKTRKVQIYNEAWVK